MNHMALPSDLGPTALLSPAWWEWNERVWGVRASEFRYSLESGVGGSLEGVFFLGRHGRVSTPPLMPHMPLGLLHSASSRKGASSKGGDWIQLADRLAEHLARVGFSHEVVLPVGFVDGRPFAWAGLKLGVSYTYAFTLPHDLSKASGSVRNKVRKAISRGYRASRSDDWAGILTCLQETESAKGFRHGLREDDLLLGAKLLGSDAFRGYVVHDSHSGVVSGGIRLHLPGHQAIDWVQGTARPALADGVNQLMYDFVMTDLHGAGATGFDLAGANIREVAAAKASWGYPLTPQLKIGQGGMIREMRSSLGRNQALSSLRLAVLDVRGHLGQELRNR